MNKNLLLFLICILFAACTSTSTEPEVEEETSSGPLEWISFEGNPDMPNIVLVSGDEEYRSEEALPQMAKILNTHHGFNCTVLFAQDPAKPGIVNPNHLSNIPGLKQLDDADLMVIFTRFRALPDEQMDHIDNYLKSGKPVIGIRTATHAFKFKDVDSTSNWLHYGNFYEGEDEWKGGFGRLVLGEKWIVHHGHHKHQSTRGVPAPDQNEHSIWSGIEAGSIWGPTDVYGVRLPLPGDSQPVVLGQVINRAGAFDENDPLYGMRMTDSEVAKLDPNSERDREIDRNNPMMPVAWTKSYQIPGGKTGKVFATTLGASTDLLAEGTRRMFVNATFWCLDLAVPEKAKVDVIGNYSPTAYAFKDETYWLEKNLSIETLK